MATISVGHKAECVLKLLYGLRHRRFADALAAHGFTEDDRKEGWSLLEALTRDRLGRDAAVGVNPSVSEQLDLWEKRWFPIADATLTAHAPAVRAWLFMSLQQTDRIAVAISVGTFISRFERLHDSVVEGEAHALSLLQRRGLTPEVIDQAKALLAKLDAAAGQPVAAPPDPQQEQAKEDALWNWFLEWSQIACTVIEDKRLLRELGFASSHRRTAIDDDLDTDEDDQASAGHSAPHTMHATRRPIASA